MSHWDTIVESVPIIESLDLGGGITVAYEAFLDAYDKYARKLLGSFYTPAPAADYIVRSVDWFLRNTFSLPHGLIDSSIGILDPASGTQVFLCAALRFLFAQIAKGEQSTVEIEEILHNFSSHYKSYQYQPSAFVIGIFNVLRLVMTLAGPENSHIFRFNGRIRDTLAHYEDDMALNSANPAIQIVWGNPPYKKDSKVGSSGLKSALKTYQDLVRTEKSLRVLSDYYVKFLRHAHAIVTMVGEGIVTFVVNNSFISGPVHRGLRVGLSQDFSDIYVLDLHGSCTTP